MIIVVDVSINSLFVAANVRGADYYQCNTGNTNTRGLFAGERSYGYTWSCALQLQQLPATEPLYVLRACAIVPFTDLAATDPFLCCEARDKSILYRI